MNPSLNRVRFKLPKALYGAQEFTTSSNESGVNKVADINTLDITSSNTGDGRKQLTNALVLIEQ